MSADFADRTDFENAERGLIATLDPCIIKDDAGRAVWDAESFNFLNEDCPDTANPSLWRQGQLCVKHGLFKVTDRLYQIRGFDLSNMSLIEGDTGVIVIDPLVSVEVAAAGLKLYREHRGHRPVVAVIYTHSHVDHFGGVEGVTDGSVPILAPAGFLEHAVAENVYAGNAMARRGLYHTGVGLPRASDGQIGTGLGLTASDGRISLIPPTLDITHTGQREIIDGVEIEFQLTPGTEAPSEMNFYFPQLQALCMAENATHNLHNLLTLRGAVVRDARAWSRYLNEAIRLFGDRADVAFASHHWPTWNAGNIVEFLAGQRDLYTYLHDQSLRMLNQGMTGPEIAEAFVVPPALDAMWHTHGYYGSVSHNVKAIYQRYLGWFDGNPARLWQHPPTASALRYVDCMGGVDEVISKAHGYATDGDLRFAAELLDKAVFAEPDNEAAKEALAGVLEKLGFDAECGTWRNFFLTGAMELRQGATPMLADISGGMASALTVEQVFDSMASRMDGPRAWNLRGSIDWIVTDTSEVYRTTLSNGALITFADPDDTDGSADLTITLSKIDLLSIAGGAGIDHVESSGDVGILSAFLDTLVTYDRTFPIVTP